MITIYKITNPSGKVYVGQTKNPAKRKHLYKIAHCKTQYMLYNSICKYGWDKHVFEIIEQVSEDKADEKEVYYIEHFKSYHTDGGMNLTRGGYRPKMTQETKDKLSKAIMSSKNYKAKKLYQYTLTDDFVKQWDSMKDIERALGYKTTWLSKATKNNKPAYGYKWSYKPL